MKQIKKETYFPKFTKKKKAKQNKKKLISLKIFLLKMWKAMHLSSYLKKKTFYIMKVMWARQEWRFAVIYIYRERQRGEAFYKQIP